MLAEIQIQHATPDWVYIGQSIGGIIAGFVLAYSAWKARQTAKTVEVIHKLTNSNLGEQLKIGAISARTLALTSKLPEHEALAKVAENKVRLHEADQSRVDEAKTA